LRDNNRRPYRISISVSLLLKPSLQRLYSHFIHNAFYPLYASKKPPI
jgi:hypothetical protein